MPESPAGHDGRDGRGLRGRLGGADRRPPTAPGGEVEQAETWFLGQGLTYFVPSVRAGVRAGLRPRRFVPPLGGVALLALAAGVLLAWWSEDVSAAPAVLLSFVLLGAAVYALTVLRTGPIVRWAGARTLGSLRLLVPVTSQALPLLLVFVTFLFINAEAWQMTANLPGPLLWLTVLLLMGLAVVFLLVRLPEEVDRVDDAVDADFLRRTTRGTPLESAAERLLARGADPAPYAQVTGYDRANLILVLLVVQVVQVLLLVVAVFCYFLVFGSLVMTPSVQEAWTGLDDGINNIGNLSVSYQLTKVSLFLAAFSGLYFTVSAVTDETYRARFFASVTEHLERAVGMRTVYLMLRDEEGSGRS
ncbi:hypothetical protein [Nocardioides litoris]|uniref:hypothetical protein n=1 Tax=Nocardioides litoris TaxID=1926648 RepID=UPI001B867F93|nr:hypothetical protein [Nocardioides litoris]